MPVAAQKGPLSTKNNLTGIEWIPVTLVNTTALTWTHTFGVCPAAVLCFNSSATVGGAQVTANTAVTVTVTTTVNTIVLTPSASINVNVLILWPNTIQLAQIVNGIPATNFV